MKKPKIGIVILNWNNYFDTKETLIALNKQSYRNSEIVVVDGKSSDDSTKKIQKEFSKLHYIFLKSDTGYSGGNNAGIKYLLNKNVDYIVSMNNDVIVTRHCLKRLIEYSLQNDTIGAVGPRMYSYFNKNLFQLSGGYVDILKAKPMPKWTNEKSVQKKYKNPYQVIKLPAALIMIKSEVVKKIGFLDENFFLYYADTDFLKRISDAGYTQVVVPRAKAYHKVSTTTGKKVEKITYYDSRDFLNYVNKHYNFIILVYALFRSYIEKSLQIIQDTDGLEHWKYLNLGYFHFLKGIKGKGI